MKNTKIDKVKVKAFDNFHFRRLSTIQGLSITKYRQLQAGQTIEINKYVFNNNKDILKEVKVNGS